MFDHTCNFRLNKEGLNAEELELELIDFGAKEVFEDEDGMMVYAGVADFGDLQKNFEENKIEILSSGFDRISQSTKELNEDQQNDVNKLLEKLEEDDDVLNVFHTMK